VQRIAKNSPASISPASGLVHLHVLAMSAILVLVTFSSSLIALRRAASAFRESLLVDESHLSHFVAKATT